MPHSLLPGVVLGQSGGGRGLCDLLADVSSVFQRNVSMRGKYQEFFEKDPLWGRWGGGDGASMVFCEKAIVEPL